MKIIIVGCGKVGETLAEQLNSEGHDIVLIDQNPAKVKAVATRHDLLGIIGNGATRATQKEAGIDSADLLIAVTGSDELNLLCCVMAKKAGSCRTIARVKSPEYAIETPYLKSELELAMIINPEYAAAKEITRILNFPMAIKVDTFAKGRVELLKFRLPETSPLIGMSVRAAAAKFRAGVLVCIAERDEVAFIPNGDFVFEKGDAISIVGAPRSAAAFFSKIGEKITPVKGAMIVGGKKITPYLLETLKAAGIDAKVIEKDRSVCEALANKYDYATIIEGDPSDKDLLTEEGVSRLGAFVALTDFDEENILLSMFAKNSGSPKTVTKINRTDYGDVMSKLGLDSIICPKNITANMILRYVRAMKNTKGSNMETLYNLSGDVEAVEFSVKEGSPLVGKPLCELKFRKNTLIAAVLRGRAMIVPGGSTVIEPGDGVVVITKGISVSNVSDIIMR